MTTEANAAGDAVHELVRQRDQLRAWIAKLDEVGTGAPSRVAERVRADYQQRLQRVTDELSAHADEVHRSLDELRAELDAAEERRAHAEDAMEEQRLRHAIGELDADAWEQARAPLEDEVRQAEDALSRTRAEVERLSSLAGEIGGAAAAEEQAPALEEQTEPPSAGGWDDRTSAGAWDEQPSGAAWEEDAGADASAEDLPFYAPAEEAEQAPAAAAFEYAPEDDAEPQSADEPRATPPSAAEPEGPVSGEELAAWITEVEAEAGIVEPAAEPSTSAEPSHPAPPAEPEQPAAPAPQDDTEGWDPFANEFGGAPASPTTQPGDATQDLPWLDSIEGGAAGKWASAPDAAADDLAFFDQLDQLDAPAPPAAEPAPADLHEDDLAFLEELDRAISGGAQRPAAQNGAPAEPAGGGLGPGFSGGSGGFSDFAAPPAETTAEQRKRGEALLCKECGAINEPQAWYCEICGSEL
jgi:ribosomal protein L40E